MIPLQQKAEMQRRAVLAFLKAHCQPQWHAKYTPVRGIWQAYKQATKDDMPEWCFMGALWQLQLQMPFFVVGLQPSEGAPTEMQVFGIELAPKDEDDDGYESSWASLLQLLQQNGFELAACIEAYKKEMGTQANVKHMFRAAWQSDLLPEIKLAWPDENQQANAPVVGRVASQRTDRCWRVPVAKDQAPKRRGMACTPGQRAGLRAAPLPGG